LYHLSDRCGFVNNRGLPHLSPKDIAMPFTRAALPDAVAGSLSLACLIHCLALPVAVAAVPALAQWLDLPESLHVAMFALALPVSSLALWRGHARHERAYPGWAGAAGLMLMAAGLIIHEWETPLTVVGSLALASAHLANWLARKADCPG
jgi:hypothetical protein